MTTITVPPAIVAILNAMSAVSIGGASYTVKAVDPPPPDAPDTARLPAAWVFTGAATDDETSTGEDWEREARDYRVQVGVMPVGQGTANEREIRCRPLLTAVKDWLKKYPHLGAAYVERARVRGDSGIVVLTEYGETLIGFEIVVRVTEHTPRVYASGE